MQSVRGVAPKLLLYHLFPLFVCYAVFPEIVHIAVCFFAGAASKNDDGIILVVVCHAKAAARRRDRAWRKLDLYTAQIAVYKRLIGEDVLNLFF